MLKRILLVLGMVLMIFTVGCNKEEIPNVDPFLSSDHLSEIDISKDWELFSKKFNSSLSQIGYFQMIVSGDLEVIDISWRIANKTDKGYVEYIYRKGNYSSKPLGEDYQFLIKEYDGPPASIARGNNVLSKDFFNKLDLIFKDHPTFTDRHHKYYVIKSSGEIASLGLDGDYYNISDSSIEKVNPEKDSVNDVYSILIHGLDDLDKEALTRTIYFYR